MKGPLILLVCLALAACGGGMGDVVAERRAPIDGPGGCGIGKPYAVTSVAGVRLSRPALMTKDLARALETYVTRVAIPEVGRRGGGLAELRVASHYACRSRNSQPGARLSEHARGRAIDISAFVLRDGTRITVEDGWHGERRDQRLLRNLHLRACGPFKTVIGPDGDRFHRDHFHFDVADYRGGRYCR